MPDAITAFIAAQQLGELQRQIALKSSLPIPGHQEADAFLCQTDGGVWLMAAISAEHGRAFDLTGKDLRYHERPLADQLEVSGQRHAVKMGDGHKVKEALAIGRLLAKNKRRRTLVVKPGPFIPNLGAVERTWLETTMAENEELLAWLDTSTKKTVGSTALPGSEVDLHYLLTSQRSALVAISGLGDVDLHLLRWAPLELSDRFGRDTVGVGDDQWRARISSGKLFARLAPVPGLEPAAALRAVAKQCWLTSTEAGVQEALRLLTSSSVPAPPLTTITALIIELLSRGTKSELADEEVERLTVALRDLRASHRGSSSQLLVDWLEAWRFPPHGGLALVALALAGEDSVDLARWALPLHRHVHQRLQQSEKKEEQVVARDVALAEHLLWAEEFDEARALLERLLAALPAQELVDLLPAADRDVTVGTQQLRVHLLELLARAGAPSEENAVALARSQPLNPKRIEGLIAASRKDLEKRAKEIRALLAKGGIDRRKKKLRNARELTSLDPGELELLRHPASREGNVLGRLKIWIGKSDVPDFDHLRAHCEKVQVDTYPTVTAAVREACLVLGLPTIPTYISRGEKSVGFCAYEGEPSFLLIGNQHLESDSDYALDDRALSFAIAAELAHLRFGHARVTVQDFYRGAWDKSGQALAIAAAALPVLRYVPLDALIGKARVYRWVRSVVPLSVLQRIYKVESSRELAAAVGQNLGPLLDAGAGGLDVARQALHATRERANELFGREPETDSEEVTDIGPDDAKLVVLCRVLQLTADRAGLLLCDDLGAALRALFLTSSRYRRELELAREHGLVACLNRRHDNDKLLFEDLAIRVAALIAFYLSEDYAALSAALSRPP